MCLVKTCWTNHTFALFRRSQSYAFADSLASMLTTRVFMACQSEAPALLSSSLHFSVNSFCLCLVQFPAFHERLLGRVMDADTRTISEPRPWRLARAVH